MIDRLQEFIAKEWREAVTSFNRPQRQAGHSVVDEAALIERAAAGSEARRFLESRVVTDFMAKAEANLTRELLNQPLEADAQRRNLAVSIQTVRQLMHYMTSLADGGASAERELERLASGKVPKPYF